MHAPQQQGDTHELNSRYQDAANVESQTCCNKILEALIDSRTLKKRCALVARARRSNRHKTCRIASFPGRPAFCRFQYEKLGGDWKRGCRIGGLMFDNQFKQFSTRDLANETLHLFKHLSSEKDSTGGQV